MAVCSLMAVQTVGWQCGQSDGSPRSQMTVHSPVAVQTACLQCAQYDGSTVILGIVTFVSKEVNKKGQILIPLSLYLWRRLHVGGVVW